MREVNFSIPNANKASVNITTTLYDRRALDCTSTLPLVNSLNHLAYLTTSSARIRDILTIDGGVERLVGILKEGRTKDLMDCWKWSLALQCVVNIGVRGSENVRTRVVEADIVPVAATVLDNYIKVMEKARARAESESHRHSSRNPLKAIHGPTSSLPSRPLYVDQSTNTEHRPSRRQAPPPHIEIPPHYQANNADANAMDTGSSPRAPPATLPERRTLALEDNPRHAHNGHRHLVMQPLSTATMDTADGLGLRPVRDTERLPSMLPGLQNGLISQPDSPTTPGGPSQLRSQIHMHGLRSRPTLLQQQSGSGDSDTATNADVSTVGSTTGSGHSSSAGDEVGSEITDPMVGMESRMEVDDVAERQSVLADVSNAHDLTVNDSSEGQEADTFNIAHRSVVDGSMIENNDAQTNGASALSPAQATDNTNSPVVVPTPYSTYIRDRLATQTTSTTMPREEDVLMALQLLAYVSKYCSLRTYFQNTHFVPKLQVDRELKALDGELSPLELVEDGEEYLQPDDVNIFPLVEHFTMRQHTKDMQYWACVVMRNLCRKDEAQGGIRQCAYWKCGKWEEFQRQFAKCRRCRRTKYCSKDCQKAAWISHRHWCHTNP
ncbi:MYND-type zinc finger protein MUB1 [Aspergillus saccharolyticus JOP 1030-1]|uniref:MYND-type zinc finger protein samB n=1 Tax=Aspergillus saccharolyticus JOP 1030-1 TaxID=1450539 RepID=A0A318ZWS8_9EURO|nr:putative MYND-type zinc finger protein samB [Aspergillus saccharolyticus JOP 1030-1]PYH44588.1 putative MYND-type zinc finger protein samB [Aspergillus saccharolyticus JOP 1030-1]